MTLEQFKSDIISERQKLLAFAWKMLGNEADAEDAVQEALLRIWKIREQLTEMDNPRGFAMQTVKNICIDKLRIQRNILGVEDAVFGANDKTPYQDMERKNSVELIRKIIKTLPELQQNIILMRDVEGYELQEIAEITGSLVSAVTMNLSRARKKVREQFLKIQSFRLKEQN